MATIVKKQLLRTGSANWGADAADGPDEWLITVDEQIDKFQMLELWLGDGSLPKPNNSFKAVATTFLLCDNLTVGVVDTQRYIWRVVVQWREINAAESVNTETKPAPSSVDPDDWRPTVTRRPVTVTEPAQKLYYEGGYFGQAHDDYTIATAAGDRSAVTNSAKVAFEDNLPLHQRKQSLWTIRWLRDTVPQALIDAELSLNDRDITFSHRGYTVNWGRRTVKLESVGITQTKWGTRDLWEIVCELLHDADGHLVTTLDFGMTEQYFPGETYGGSPLASCKTVLIKVDGKPTPEPMLLNGGGKRLACDLEPKFGEWRDFEEEDFNTLPLLGDLVSNTPPPP